MLPLNERYELVKNSIDSTDLNKFIYCEIIDDKLVVEFKESFPIIGNIVEKFDPPTINHFVDIINVRYELYISHPDNEEFLSSNNHPERLNFSKFVFHENLHIVGGHKTSFFFNESKFKKNLILNNTTFYGNVRFHNAIFFGNLHCKNTTFKGLVDFFCTVFEKKTEFHLTDFFDRAIFSNVTFNKPVKFKYNRVNSDTIISFESAVFNSYVDLSRANFNCTLNFWNVQIEESNIEEFKTFFSDYSIEEKKDDKIHLKRIRETFRIIKNSFLKNGDTINATIFREKEMSIFALEDHNFKETIILFLNKISNNFGKNWFQGIKFSICVSIITYFLIFLAIVICREDHLVNFHGKYIQSNLKNIVQILNITNWREIPYNSDNGLVFSILFVGRLFIAYGYYQTVVAFRKFNRK